MNRSFFPHRPSYELYEPFVLVAASVGTAMAGVYAGYPSAAPNTFLVLFGVRELWLLQRGRRGLRGQQAASEVDVRDWVNLTSTEIKRRALVPRSSVFIQLLHLMVRKLEAGRPPEFQTQIDAYRNLAHRTPARARRQAGVIVSMGMLGTLFGLAMTSSATAEVLRQQADGGSELTAALLPAFSSMAVAYSTTLTALVFGAILLVSMSWLLSDDIDSFFDQLESQLSDVNFRKID